MSIAVREHDAKFSVVYVPVFAFALHLTLRLLIGGTDHAATTMLTLALFWLVGVQGIIAGSGHMLTPAPVAKSIGWPTSPFQWEVGLADVSYGVLGVMAPWFGPGFWLATIIAFSIFMLGAAIGHMRSMVRDRNFAPGNAGFFFWYDIVVPLGLFVLYALRVA